jgi:hypothetical protein
LGDSIEEVPLGFDDAVLIRDEANEHGKFDVAEILNLLREPVNLSIHLRLLVESPVACGCILLRGAARVSGGRLASR